jgi:hypothetical protein
VIYIVMFVLFVQIIFSGTVLELKGALKAASWLTLTHWTIDALGSTVDLPALGQLAKALGQPVPFTSFRIAYAHDAHHLISRWVTLAGYTLALGAAVYLRLRTQESAALAALLRHVRGPRPSAEQLRT